MTVAYLLADLLQRSYSSDRETLLRRAFEQYERYLTSLDDYGLLSASDKKLYERYTADPTKFSLTPVNDAATRREIKVNRLKEEKELKQKLEVRLNILKSFLWYLHLVKYLSRNHNRLQSDDEDVRKLYLAELNLYTHETFQSLDLLSQELSMLSAIRNAPPSPDESYPNDPRRRNNTDRNYSDRLDPPLSQLLQGGRSGPILNRQGKPMQPFTLLDRRTQLQQGVFRPGHNLPTMTIDEYLEEEKRRGNVIEGGGEPAAQEVDEDDMDKADEETMKARAWDEFTEANPRGSGNTLNRG